MYIKLNVFSYQQQVIVLPYGGYFAVYCFYSVGLTQSGYIKSFLKFKGPGILKKFKKSAERI